MAKFAVVKTGGKQYLVQENDKLTIDSMDGEKDKDIQLQTLAVFDTDKVSVELGAPELKKKAVAKILVHGKGEKVRVARFKAKVRYRKVKGFRPSLTQVQITKI